MNYQNAEYSREGGIGSSHKAVSYACRPSPSASGEYLPENLVPGWRTMHHTCLDSTNFEARRLVFAGVREKCIIVADAQTEGQCRHNQLWESPAGKGVWASYMLPVSAPLENLPQSTLVFAVAVREGVYKATGVSLAVKWPNDLLGDGKKCSGLLVETTGIDERSGAEMLILGAGVNHAQEEHDFPEYLRAGATSLSILANGKQFCRKEILRCVACAIERWFVLWERVGFSPIRSEWLAVNCTIGKAVVLPEGYGYSHGVACDLEDNGALKVLTDDGAVLLIDSGEVRHC